MIARERLSIQLVVLRGVLQQKAMGTTAYEVVGCWSTNHAAKPNERYERKERLRKQISHVKAVHQCLYIHFTKHASFFR